MISLSEIEKKKNVVLARVEKPRELLVNLPTKRVREFRVQDILSTLLAEKLPLGLRRIFK